MILLVLFNIVMFLTVQKLLLSHNVLGIDGFKNIYNHQWIYLQLVLLRNALIHLQPSIAQPTYIHFT